MFVCLWDRRACEIDLEFLGLIIIMNELRTTSRDTMTSLKGMKIHNSSILSLILSQAAGIRCLMATGDAPRTAMAIGALVGLIRPDVPVLCAEVENISSGASATPDSLLNQSLDALHGGESNPTDVSVYVDAHTVHFSHVLMCHSLLGRVEK